MSKKNFILTNQYMIKIGGKMDKSVTYKELSNNDISFFIPRISSD